MLAPYRITPTPEPASFDETDAYEAHLRAKATRMRLVAIAICGSLACASVVSLAKGRSSLRARHRAAAETTMQISNAREVVGAAKSFVLLEQARFSAAMNDAFAANVISDGARPRCDLSLTRASAERQPPPLALSIVAASAPEVSSPSLTSILADAEDAEALLAAGRFDEALAAANALGMRVAGPTTRPRYDVVLVTTEVKPPLVTNSTSYEPGELSGRAYVYDFDRHRVTCVGDVQATNSRRIEYTFARSSFEPASLSVRSHLLRSLDEDLELQLRRELEGDTLSPVRYKAERREPGADTEFR